MKLLSSRQFGTSILLKNTPDKGMGAHAMISQFLNIKKFYKSKIDSVTKEDPHASRYFCKNDCAYIFDVDILETLVKAIREVGEKGDGCVVLFQGLRKENIIKNDDKKGATFGRPTLIAVPYKVNKDGNFENFQFDYAENNDIQNSSLVDGFEHPGDGKGHCPLLLKQTIKRIILRIPL